jgi:tetratricopeptide (TPR) repeat protein
LIEENFMSTLRTLGIVLGAFIISLPAMYVMNNGLPANWTVPVATAEEAEEDRDDPVVDALCLKGLLLMGDEKYDKAIAAYSDAISRDPKYSFAYVGRGDVYLAKGDLDRALLDYNHAVRLDPNNDSAKARARVVSEQRTRP